MTLTIEQVRDCKFHLARRNGYEPVDVDNFVDKVEETLVALNEEIATLKKQGGGVGVVGGDPEVEGALKRQLADRDAEIERAKAEAAAQRGEVDRLKNELAAAHSGESDDMAKLRADLEGRHGELANLQAELESQRAEIQRLQGLVQAREEELAAVKAQFEEAQAAVGEGKPERLVLSSAPEASVAVTRLLEMATTQADDLVNGTASLTESVQTYFDRLMALLAPEEKPGASKPGQGGAVFGGTSPGSSGCS